MSTKFLSTSLVLTSLLGTALTLSACTAASNEPGTEAIVSGESMDTATPEAAEQLGFDWLAEAPETNTEAFLAWEALMGPDGEFAALASYQAVLDRFGGVEPYATIKEAESRHADALIRQLDRLAVSVPATNPYLGTIEAPSNLELAAIAWAEGEVANVELYDRLMTEAESDQLLRVFTNLRRASAESHLPAFQAAAENGGTLSSEQMAQIMHD